MRLHPSVAQAFPEVRLFRKANGGAATARNRGNAQVAMREFLASARIRPLQLKPWVYVALSAFSLLTGKPGG